MATPTRIYLVGDGTNPSRLVKAVSQAQALMHVARAQYRYLRAASATDVAQLMTEGAKVEDATDANEPQR